MLSFLTNMIDLHTHSTASDGTYRPAALVSLAAKKGIAVLALTDHDTTAGLAEAQEAARKENITFVPGIEISVDWPSGEFHLLGLGLKTTSQELRYIIEELCAERMARNQKMVQKLNEAGVPLCLDDVMRSFETQNIGRPHFAAVMQQNGFVKTRQEAFDRYFAKGRPCFVDRKGVDLAKAVSAITASGGIPVQAHPLSLYIAWGKMEETMALVKEAGVQGLEAWHPGARLAEAERLEALAHTLGMICTGGSDFHGESVRADRHLGFASGKRPIPDRLWSQELFPLLSATPALC